MKTTMMTASELDSFVNNGMIEMINILDEQRKSFRKSLNEALKNEDVDKTEEYATIVAKINCMINGLNGVKNMTY